MAEQENKILVRGSDLPGDWVRPRFQRFAPPPSVSRLLDNRAEKVPPFSIYRGSPFVYTQQAPDIGIWT